MQSLVWTQWFSLFSLFFSSWSSWAYENVFNETPTLSSRGSFLTSSLFIASYLFFSLLSLLHTHPSLLNHLSLILDHPLLYFTTICSSNLQNTNFLSVSLRTPLASCVDSWGQLPLFKEPVLCVVCIHGNIYICSCFSQGAGATFTPSD